MNPELTPVVGDRVKLVHPNGDEATITVTATRAGYAIESVSNYFYISSNDGPTWSVAEILEPVLPTEPGLYAANGHSNQRFLMLTAQGNWWWVDWSYTGSLGNADDHVAKYARTMKKVFPL